MLAAGGKDIPVTLTDNGLVLVAISELMQVPFKHLVTSLDEEQGNSQSNCGRAASITGYTEWLSETQPYLSVGWDWVVDEREQGSSAWRLGSPRTNVNLVSNDGQVLQWEASLEKLGQLIDILLPWQQAVQTLEVHQTAV